MTNDTYLESIDKYGLRSDVGNKLRKIFEGEDLEKLAKEGTSEDINSCVRKFHAKLTEELERYPTSSEFTSGYLGAITIWAKAIGRTDWDVKTSAKDLRKQGLEIGLKKQKSPKKSKDGTPLIPKLGSATEDSWKLVELYKNQLSIHEAWNFLASVTPAETPELEQAPTSASNEETSSVTEPVIATIDEIVEGRISG